MNETGATISPLWRIAHSVSIVEAALLLVNREPQDYAQEIEGWADSSKPDGYLAARNAVTAAILNRDVDGSIIHPMVESFNNQYLDENIVDYRLSRVEVESLTDWLSSRGWREGYFFPGEAPETGFRNRAHPRYAPKLAAIVQAWEAQEAFSEEPGTLKQRLMKWLRLNTSRFELTDDDGKPRENVIEELAKVANWAPGGGAPKVATQVFDGPREDFSHNMDDDIPF